MRHGWEHDIGPGSQRETGTTWAKKGASVATMSVLTAGRNATAPGSSDKYKWNLADIYPDLAAWRSREGGDRGASAEAAGLRGQARRRRRRSLADALELHVTPRQGAVAALRLRQHARRRGHARVASRRACSRRCSSSTPSSARRRPTSSRRSSAPAARRSRIHRRRAASGDYAFYLRDIFRRAAHTLTDAEEKILADAAAAGRLGVEHLRHPRRTPIFRIRPSR